LGHLRHQDTPKLYKDFVEEASNQILEQVLKDLIMPIGKGEKVNEQEKYLQKLTVAIFGDSGVGKTSLVNPAF